MKQFKCTNGICSVKIGVGSTQCPNCGKTYGVFRRHDFDALVKKYSEKSYQGQSPRDANVIFIGRDANFDSNISEKPYIFNIFLEYLQDGVKFWENSNNPKFWEEGHNHSYPIRKVHHPFLLPAYGKKDGYMYHYNFSKLNLDSQYAQFISFVEIISVPTTGYWKNDPYDQLKLLTKNSLQHVSNIEGDILSGGKKCVLISDSAMYALGNLDKMSKFYELIHDKRKESSIGIPPIHSFGNVTIHKCYHFSDPKAKTSEHKDKLVNLIKNYCNQTSG